MTIRRFALATVAAFAALAATHQEAQADFASVGWDIPCCAMEGASHGIATTTLVICNCTQVEAEYDWFLKTMHPGVTFSPSSGVVTLAAGECIEIPITIHCPTDGGAAGMTGFLYSACITNALFGTTFEAEGLVRDVVEYKVIPTDPIVDVLTADPASPVVGPPSVARLLVDNLGSSGKDGVSINPIVMQQGLEVIPQWVNPIHPQPGESVVIDLEIRALPGGQFRVDSFFDIILEYDADGDGAPDQASSLRARGVSGPCIGDLDGDGTVGSADLAELIGRWGPCP